MERNLIFFIPILILTAGLSFESVFIIEDWNKNLKKAAWFKGLASLCFVLLGGFFVKVNPSAPAWFILLGLISGLSGDICLAVKKFLKGIPSAVINTIGILSFMTGHFLYIVGLFYGGILNLKLGCILWAVIYIPVIIFLLRKSKGSPAASRIMGCIYLSVVTSMFCTASALFSVQKNMFSGLFASGGFLFVISDIITMFNSLLTEKPKILRAANLAVYYGAQILISFSILFF